MPQTGPGGLAHAPDRAEPAGPCPAPCAGPSLRGLCGRPPPRPLGRGLHGPRTWGWAWAGPPGPARGMGMGIGHGMGMGKCNLARNN